MMDEEYSIDISEIFALLIQHFQWIILSMVIMGGIGFILNWYILKPVYQAEAMMIVNTRDEQNVVVTNDQINSAKQLVNTYEVILRSDTVMDQLLIALENRGFFEEDKMTSEMLKQKIIVAPVNNTQIMKVSALDENPDLAFAMVDEVVTIAPSIIIRTVKVGSVEVVSYPKLYPEPVSPHKVRNLALFIFGGLFLAVGIIFLQDFLDSTIKTDDDIRRKLDLPVLGVIPKIREGDLNTERAVNGSVNEKRRE